MNNINELIKIEALSNKLKKALQIQDDSREIFRKIKGLENQYKNAQAEVDKLLEELESAIKDERFRNATI